MASIDSLQVTPSKTEKDFVTVVVQGVTKGDGWTNPQLAPRDSVPTGPTRSYTVVATPPAASKTQASTKFTASLKIMLPPDVKTIVVYSETNQESQAVR